MTNRQFYKITRGLIIAGQNKLLLIQQRVITEKLTQETSCVFFLYSPDSIAQKKNHMNINPVESKKSFAFLVQIRTETPRHEKLFGNLA